MGRVHAAAPSCPATGVVAWWPADGDATERINGNNGTLEGGVTFVPGKIGQAFSFDGSTGRVLVPKSPLWALGSNDFTIDLWANFNFVPPSTVIGNPSAVFVSNDEGPGGRNKWIFALGAGLLYLHVHGPSVGAHYLVPTAFDPVLHQWYHLAITRSGNTFTLYINGAAVNSEVNPIVIPTPDAPLTIGEAESIGYGQTFFMNGLIDEVEIYSRALSASELSDIFIAGSSGVKCNTPPSTWGEWPASGNGRASEPINTATGNYYTSRTDLTVPGKGLPFNFTRFYNSLDPYSGTLGVGWTHSFNIVLREAFANGPVTIKEGDGHEVSFNPTGGGNYTPATPGLFDALNKNFDGSFTLTRKNQTQLNFSSAGKLLTVVDRNGNTKTLSYSGGNLTSITDSSGRVFTLSYDGSNRIISLTEPTSRTWQYSYDAGGNLITVQDPAGGLTQYSYDASHRMTSATDPRGVVILQNTYDVQGRVVTQKNARGFTTTLAYNTPSPGTTTITDALGNTTKHTHDAGLRLITVVDAKGGIVSYTYDANNDRTSVTNQNGKTTSFTYDAQGNVLTITDPLASVVTFTYDAKNNLLTAKNAKGNTTAFFYDGKGNLTSIKDVLANTTSFVYNPSGLLTSKTDARGNATAFAYDSAGNLTGITDPLGNTTTLAYDAIGRLTAITDANGHSATSAYDLLSRLVKSTDPVGNQMQFAYDPVGNLLKITDANLNATSYAYDGANNLTTVTDAVGGVTMYSYDANNNRITFRNAKGNTTSYAYDALNRLSKITDPLGFATSYVFDAVGNVLTTTDAKTQTNQLTYDALNRLTNIAYSGGNTVVYAYDANRNRTSMVDSRGTTAYSFDALDRLVSVTHPGPKTVTYSYGAVGNRTSLTYPDGKSVNYTYDKANRLASVTDQAGRTTNYTYDPGSNLSSVLYPNLAGMAFTYDAANRLTQLRNSYRGSEVIDPNPVTSFTYVLDPVGNRLQVADGSGVITRYGYDPLYQLTSAQVADKLTTYSYDAVGNRLSLTAPGNAITYTYDAADRLMTAGTTTFSYDANGNQITKTVGGMPQTFAYDAANRLLSATVNGVASTFSYDGDGNRVSQSVSGLGAYSYLNDIATPLPVALQESGPDGDITYAYGLGLMSATSSAFDYFYHYDGLGSVAGLTDPVGKLKGRYVYDAWGQTVLAVANPQIGTQNKFRFTGEALDPGTGLYYLRARYYDQSLGRFIKRDPLAGSVGRPLTWNRYLYAQANPIRYTDPSGLSSTDQPQPTQLNAAASMPAAPVNPPSVGSTLLKQAACGSLPFCTTAVSEVQFSQGLDTARANLREQLQPVVASCVGQLGSGVGLSGPLGTVSVTEAGRCAIGMLNIEGVPPQTTKEELRQLIIDEANRQHFAILP